MFSFLQEYKTLKHSLNIRQLIKVDLPQVASIILDNELFPPEYLDKMTQTFFDQNSQEMWFVADSSESGVIGVAYCAPERMTQGAWNLLLIAVMPEHHGNGVGSQLIRRIEQYVRPMDARVLLIETSGLEAFSNTRKFYPKCGYRQVATIPEYYDTGDDKVVFWKSMLD